MFIFLTNSMDEDVLVNTDNILTVSKNNGNVGMKSMVRFVNGSEMECAETLREVKEYIEPKQPRD